jgi:hypothetical protein
MTENEKVPSYYVGKHHGYEAHKIIEDYELTYNIGTAVSYLLRNSNKHDTPIECLEKAIAHIEFEIEHIKFENKDTSEDLTLSNLNEKILKSSTIAGGLAPTGPRA